MPTSRCVECAKKTGLLGFSCKCGKVLCAQHRLPFEHNCTFDHKAAAHQRLSKQNPQVVAEKVVKIVSDV